MFSYVLVHVLLYICIVNFVLYGSFHLVLPLLIWYAWFFLKIWCPVFRWDTHLYVSVFPSVPLSVHPSVVHHISVTIHHLIIIFGTHVKWWGLQAFFSFFEILIFWAVRRVKGHQVAQNEKQQLHSSCTISQEQYSISWFLVHLCKMMIYPGVFIFLKFSFSGKLWGLTGFSK